MARLPIPGGDSGTWGVILNDYLAQAHDATGQLRDTGLLASKYSKPPSGIPASDLDPSVRDVLDTVFDHTTELAQQAIALSDHASTLSHHSIDLAAKVSQDDLSTLSSRIDGSLKEDGTLKDQSVAHAALGADLAAASDYAALSKLGISGPASRFQWKPANTSLPNVANTGIVLGTAASSPSNPLTDSPLSFVKEHPAFRYFGSTLNIQAPYYKRKSKSSYWAVDFVHDGQKFAFNTNYDPTARFRLVVDGVPSVLDQETGQQTGTPGWSYWVTVDFGSRATRHIVIEMNQSVAWQGVSVEKTDAVMRSSTPRGPVVVVLGDSYTDAGIIGWAMAFAREFGWRDVQCAGNPGGGYLAVGNDASGTFRTWLTTAPSLDRTPDIFILQGGYNDLGQAAGVAAEAPLAIAAATAKWPKAWVAVMGPQYPSGSPVSNVITVRNAVQSATLGAKVPFVDWVKTASARSNVLGFITGTGKAGAPANNGNADRYISADGVHPTGDGHRAIGKQAAGDLLSLVAL